jgi:hypothetical protein
MPASIIAYAATITIEQIIVSFVVNYALSTVINAVFGEGGGEGDTPPPEEQGTRQQIPPSTNNTIPIVYGTAFLGGTFVDAALTTDQKVMYYVMAISSISGNGTVTYDTSNMYFGDRKIAFSGGTPSVASLSDQAIPPNVDTTIAGNLEIYLYTSTPSGVVSRSNTTLYPWDVMGAGSGLDASLQWSASNRNMNGLAFAIVKLTYSREANTTQLLPVTFKVTQNLNGLDRARPADCWYDYLTNFVYGCAVDTAYVDTVTRDALNTYSDQLITYIPSGGGSATQRRYTINGVVNAGDDVLTNLSKILVSCDSWLAYNAVNGKWSIIINKPETTAYFFDDTNIIGEIQVSCIDIASSINKVEAKFPNKDNKDQLAFVNVDTPSILLFPNEPVNKYSITLDYVNNNIQAEYLANRMLEQAREDLIVNFSTTFYGIQVDAGDVIAVTNSGYGWNNKLFRVMRVNEVALEDGTLGAKLQLNEYNAQVYDDLSVTAFSPAPNSGLPSPIYFSALTAPTVTSSDPTATVPTFDVQVTIPTIGRVTFINLFYTTNPTPSASDWTSLAAFENPSSLPFTNGSTFSFLHNSLPAGTYYFGYIVGNDISQSPISALSTAFAWSPVGAGLNVATVSLYQWLATTPASPTGNSTYTWATSTNSGYTASDGWYVTIPANPLTSGLKLWAATKNINAPSGTVTTTINWTSGSSIVAIAVNGTVGNSARICFARVASNPTPVSGTVTTSGGASFPTSGDSLTTWGFSATWVASDPNPASTDSLYQADGIYDPSAGTTTWTTPYISSLKVGTLSAITANMGTLTSGEIIVGTSPAVSGNTMTGTGTHLYSNGRFVMGNSTTNITFNGTNAYLNGFTSLAQIYGASTSTEYWNANTQIYDQYTSPVTISNSGSSGFDSTKPIFLLLTTQLGLGVTTSGNSAPPALVVQQAYIEYAYSTNGGSTYTSYTSFGYPARVSAISANYTTIYGFNRNFINSGAFNLQFDIASYAPSATNIRYRIWRRYIAYGDYSATTVGYFGGVVIPPSYTEVETYFNAATLMILQVKA